MLKQATIAVVGAKGAGKTTFLVTMYPQAPAFVRATPATQSRFTNLYEQLTKRITTYPVFQPLEPLLPVTSITGQFEISWHQQTLLGVSVSEWSCQNDKLLDNLAETTVIFNIIDGVSLLETKSPPREDWWPALLNSTKQHLIIFIMTKSEAWFKQPQICQTAFERHYQTTLTLLTHQPHLVAVFIPVKTLGCVEFSHYHRQTEAIFVKKPRLKFAPQHTAQPLLYALTFILSQYQQKRHLLTKIATKFAITTSLSKLPLHGVWHKLHGEQPALVAIKQSLNQQRKSFQVYGNSSLLMDKGRND